MIRIPKYEFSEAELERMEKNPWLSDREKMVFELYYRRKWSIEDIAANIDKKGNIYDDSESLADFDKGINRSTVCKDLQNIRKKSEKTSSDISIKEQSKYYKEILNKLTEMTEILNEIKNQNNSAK